MSKQDATTYINRWEQDKAFKTSLLNAKNLEERKAILKKANLHFSKEEYRQAYKEKYHKELTEAELAKIVAAGMRPGKLEGVENTVLDMD